MISMKYITLTALAATLSGSPMCAETKPAQSNVTEYNSVPLQDETDKTDIFAIPLDNSEKEEQMEMQELKAEAQRIEDAKKKENQTK